MRYKRFSHAIGLLLPFFILLSIALVFLVIQNRRYRSKHKKEIFSNELNLRKMIQSHKKDEMEIEPNNVELYELLGEGKHTQKSIFFFKCNRLDCGGILFTFFRSSPFVVAGACCCAVRCFWYCSKGRLEAT